MCSAIVTNAIGANTINAVKSHVSYVPKMVKFGKLNNVTPENAACKSTTPKMIDNTYPTRIATKNGTILKNPFPFNPTNTTVKNVTSATTGAFQPHPSNRPVKWWTAT